MILIPMISGHENDDIEEARCLSSIRVLNLDTLELVGEFQDLEKFEIE